MKRKAKHMYVIDQKQFNELTTILQNPTTSSRQKAYLMFTYLFGSERKFLSTIHNHDDLFKDFDVIVNAIDNGQTNEHVISLVVTFMTKVTFAK